MSTKKEGKKRAGGAFDARPARRGGDSKRQDFYALLDANPGVFLDPTDGDFSTCLYVHCNICGMVTGKEVRPTQKSLIPENPEPLELHD